MNLRNEPCWCGSQKKWKKCHFPEKPSLKNSSQIAEKYFKQYGIIIKTPEQIAGIKQACHVASHILNELCLKAKAGITTNELNDYANLLHKEFGAIPAPLGYGDPPFPKSICTSLNEVICHGIPDNRPLQEGDIVNIDVTSIVNGYYGDLSRMVCIGQIDENKQRVVDVSLECLQKSIQILKPGVPLYAIGDIIEEHAKLHRCSVVNQFVGHGIGVYFHENPQVFHHSNNCEILLAPGMTFTIEPMINAGKREGIVDKHDHWTTRTIDNQPSAQWEHTILITETGHEVLTSYFDS
ncbi:MAG: methionyl aminopeptidase [Rhabdochlamydiaceae bacterium]